MDSGVTADTPLVTPARQGADFLRGLTINALLDTYYEHNTTPPSGA